MALSLEEAKSLLAQLDQQEGSQKQPDSDLSLDEAKQLYAQMQELDKAQAQPAAKKSEHPAMHVLGSLLGVRPEAKLIKSLANIGVSAGQTMGQALDNIVNTVAGTHLKSPQVATPGISKGIGEFLGIGTTMAVPGSVAGAALRGLEAAPEIAAGIQRLRAIPGVAKLLPAAGRVAGTAGFGATQAAEGHRQRAALYGAGLGVGAEALAPAAKLGAAKLLSPALKQNIQKQTNRFLDKIRGSSSAETVNEDLYNITKQHHEELEGNKEGLTKENAKYVLPENSIAAEFNRLGDINKEIGLPYKKKSYEDAIEEEIKRHTKLTEGLQDPVLQTQRESNLKRIEKWKESPLRNFDDASNLHKDLNKIWAEDPKNTDLRHSITNIKEGLRKTSQDTAEGNPVLKEAWEKANKRFKEEIIPFRETSAGKETHFWNIRSTGGKDTDRYVSSYIKPGETKDQATLIKDMFKTLPDKESKDLAVYGYFRGTENNPLEFVNRYEKLGINQKKLMFDKPDMEDLEQLSKIKKAHPSLFKEKEGELKKIARGTGEVGASLGLGMLGHPMLAAVPFAAPLLQRGVSKAVLSSPGAREAIMRTLSGRPSAAKASQLLSMLGRGTKGTIPAWTIEQMFGRSSINEDNK